MLGIPVEDEETVFRWAQGLLHYAIEPEEAKRCARELTEYVLPIVADRRRDPGDDMISRLVTETTDDGERLDDEQVLSFVRLLYPVGADTTMLAMGNVLAALLTHPEQLDEADLAGQEGEEGDGDQRRGSRAVFGQKHVVGSYRRSGRHRIAGDAGFLQRGPQRGRYRPQIGTAADQQDFHLPRLGKEFFEIAHRQRGRIGRFPAMDTRRQAQQRASMRHIGKAEAAIAIGLDRRRAWQMRCVGGRHALTPWRWCRPSQPGSTSWPASRRSTARHPRDGCRRRDRSGSGPR